MMLTIAVSGKHGAGKSTVAKALADKFHLRCISAGKIFRDLAKERGMSLADFSLVAEKDPQIDREIDDRTSREAANGNVVIDAYIAGWVASHFADIKIYLQASLEVRVRRMAERDHRGYTEMLEETRAREESQRHRFREFYGIDVTDIRIFDLVLNTETWDEAATISICIEAVKAYLASSGKTRE
jgi:cytidylate kinase